MRHTALLLALLMPSLTLAAAPPPGAQVPRGQPLDPARPFAWEIDPGVLGAEFAALPAQWLVIDPRGVITLDGPLPADARPVPLAAYDGAGIIAPLWGGFGADPCAPAERADTVELAIDRAARTLAVSWFRRSPCGRDQDAVFATVLARRDDGGLSVTFLYQSLPPSHPTAQPRAGLVLAEAVELLPDGPDAPSDRAKTLLSASSERVIEPDPNDPRRQVEYVTTPGRWVIELDRHGALTGDEDGDGIRAGDNCFDVPNPLQRNLDRDGEGDACDADDDDDNVLDRSDNCPLRGNRDQGDLDGDGFGDACDLDRDGDGLLNYDDLCPGHPDPARLDLDRDGVGDACDPDADGDGLSVTPPTEGELDLCPYLPDLFALDRDGDGVGDGCDLEPRRACRPDDCPAQRDSDGDGIADRFDRCPTVSDARQRDQDGDGVGDRCDPDANGDGILDFYQRCVGCFDRGLPVIIAPMWTPGAR
ncbi:MAG: thrombospondin type 3 repeat-containing protein [bacterium]